MEQTEKVIGLVKKIGRIVCEVIKICCIVYVGLALLMVFILNSKVEGSINFDEFVAMINLSLAGIITLQHFNVAAVASIILSIGEAVVAGFTANFFKKELKKISPFNRETADGMMKTGILIASISLGSLIVVSIVSSIMMAIYQIEWTLSFNSGGTILIGIGFVLISYLLRYGTELLEKKQSVEVIEHTDIVE